MSCSVNLVPAVRLNARTRARRCASWVAVCAVTGVLLAAAWTVQRTAAAALARLAAKVNAVDVQRAEVQRRLGAAAAEQTRLFEQLQAIAAARPPQPWAQRLVTLTREAPEGVFLTAVNVTTPGAEPAPTAGARFRPGPTPRRSEPPSGDVAPGVRDVRLLGHALDHGALIQLINTLQGLPGWQQVQLVRATLEPYRGGYTVAFELACRTQEDR